MTVKAELYFFDRTIGENVVKPQSKFKYKKPEVWTGVYYDVEKELTVVSPDALEIVSDRSHIVLPTGIQPLGIEPQKLEEEAINRAQIVIPSRIPGIKTIIRWESDKEEPQEPSEDYPHINPEDREPTLSMRLMEVATEWAENPAGDLKLFAVENVYVTEEPVVVNIRLSGEIFLNLIAKGMTRQEIISIPSGILEGEIGNLFKNLTSEPVPLRISKWHRNPKTFATNLKGVTLHSEPLNDTNTGFYLHSYRKAK